MRSQRCILIIVLWGKEQKKLGSNPTIFEIHPKVHEINLARADFVDILNQVFRSHFIGYIFYHDSRTSVKAFLDASNIQEIAVIARGRKFKVGINLRGRFIGYENVTMVQW